MTEPVCKPIEGFSNYVLFEHTQPDGTDAMNVKTHNRMFTKGGCIKLSDASHKKHYVCVAKLRSALFGCALHDEKANYEWRIVPGAPAYGIFKNKTPNGVDVFNIQTNRIMSTSESFLGYMMIAITNGDGKKDVLGIARLRLLTFVGRPPLDDKGREYTADHINQVRSDDAFDNLRWASRSEQRSNQSKFVGHQRKLPIKRRHIETGVEERFSCATDVPDMNAFNVYYHIRKRPKCSKYEWDYDFVELYDGELVKHVTRDVYASDRGRLLRKLNDGYLDYPVSSDRKYPSIDIEGKTLKVHRVVYELFVGPIEPGMVINHIDSNKSNFALVNLEMVTQSENSMHSRGLVYELTNKETGETTKVVGRCNVAKIIGVAESNVQNYYVGRKTDTNWLVTRLGKHNDSYKD